MPAPRIKICGLNNAEALEAAINARAEFAGLNFYPPSPRFVDSAKTAALGEQARGRIEAIGVFVDAEDAAIGEAVSAAGLGGIQLHGSETPERAAALGARFGLPVWKVISVAKREDLDHAAAFAGAADFILFDAKTPKGALPGGMGLTFDWSLLAGWQGALPWGLAGGLNPATVAQAVALTRAPLVDVSSGVERAPGIKDAALIHAFCETARGA